MVVALGGLVCAWECQTIITRCAGVRPTPYRLRVNMAAVSDEEIVARAEAELAALRLQGDRLEAELRMQPSRHTRCEGVSAGSATDADFLLALAAEDEQIAADLARMRREAEEEAERQAEEEACAEERLKALEKTRQDMLETARMRDTLCAASISDALIGTWAEPATDEAAGARPLTSVAEQARVRLRRTRERFDQQRASGVQLAQTPPVCAGHELSTTSPPCALPPPRPQLHPVRATNVLRS